MYPPGRYLAWAIRHYGTVEHDLASSGMTPLPLARVPHATDLDDPSGWARLPPAIARHLDLPPDEVCPALGTAHALWLAYAAVTSPGDEVLVESPAYEPLVTAAAGLGATANRFPRPHDERYAVDPDRVARALSSKTRVVALSSLHNPSGARVPDEVLSDVAKACARAGAYLLVDEVYAPFDAFAGADGVWRASARKLGDNVIATCSLTKCYGLGANRFGWLAAPRDVVERARDATLSSVGHLPLAHANQFVAALGHVPELAARARALLGAKRETVARWMAARRDVAWSAPDAGLFGFAKVLTANGRDLLPDVERAIASRGLIVAPGAFFGVPDALRVSWSIDEERLPRALEALGATLDAVPRG